MRIIRSALNFVILATLLIVLSSISVAAQLIVVKYKFLETTVVDTEGKPVDEAVVETIGYREKILKTLRTDRDGRLPKGLPVSSGDIPTFGFRVSKPGYFPYEDLGTISGPFSPGSDQPIKLELLTIPRTPAGAVGDEQRKREFLVAAKKGDAATVRKLLHAGLNPNLTTSDLRGVPGPKNIPAIVWAATSGDGETVAALLAAGANVRNKGTPANKALIVYLQADYWSKLSGTETEAQIAIARRNYDNGVQRLIEAGADANAVSIETGKTTLMLCATRCSAETMRRLLEKGVPVNAKDNNGITALAEAITSRSLEIINLVLEAGVNPNEIYYDSPEICSTSLTRAVEVDSMSILRLLIKNKADMNLACSNGETILIFAVRSSHIKAVKTLIELGADVKGKQGQLALARARKQQDLGVDSREMISLLEAAGAREQ
jgi:ankyrin repeat protein